MHKIFRILMLMLATALVACGGGGGSPGGNPNQPLLHSTAPSSLSLPIGKSSLEYSINGGTPPYKIVNGNSNIAIGMINGNIFTVGAKSAGKTTISIVDNSGLQEITVNIQVGKDFKTSAPDSIKIEIGATAAQTFDLEGGSAPYTAVSSANSIATVNIIDAKMIITGLAPGDAEITARDASGSEKKISVTVNPPAPPAKLFTTADGDIEISLGAVGSRTFTIGGGTAPYTASSSNNGFVSVAVNGKSLFVTGNAVGSATVTVRDAAGQTIPIAVKVSSVVPLFTTADGPISLFPGAGGVRNFTIGGGTAPYSASSSNSAIVSVAVNGNNLVITGLVVSGTPVTVTVRDNVGGLVTIPVTVANVVPLYVNAPSTLTLSIGAALAPTYEIGGGTAPYTAVSDNTAVATVSVNQTILLIQGISSGKAVVQVRDAQGAIVALTINVTADPKGLPLYTTAPANLSIGVGAAAQRNFYIGGGAKPYTIEGNNNSVPIVQKIGEDQWTVTGVAIGAATIKIRDAAGNEVGVNLDVNSPALRISPTDLAMPVGLTAIAKISGGQKPYIVAGGIPAAISAKILNGDELHIMGSLASSLDISVADAAGNFVKVSVKINTATTDIRLSPSAVSISEQDTQEIKFTLFGAATGVVCFFSDNPSLLKPVISTDPQQTCINSKDASLGMQFVVQNGTLGSRCVSADTPVKITVVDSARSVANATITIIDNGTNCNQNTNLISMQPSALNVPVGTKNDATIVGGSGGYVVTSTDPSVATAVISGRVLTVSGLKIGSANITVTDLANSRISATVAVTVLP